MSRPEHAVHDDWPQTVEGLVLAKNEILGAAREAFDEGRKAEALAALERLARELEAGGANVAAAEALVVLGHLIGRTDTNGALVAFERARRLDPASAPPLDGLTSVMITLGRLDEALVAARGAIDAAEPGDFATVGAAMLRVGIVHSTRGDLELAEAALMGALEVFARAQNGRGAADTLNMLANILVKQGRYDEAIERWDSLFGIAEEQQSDTTLMLAHHGRATVLENLGRLDEAVADYEAALALAREGGDRDGEASATLNLGNIASRRGDYATARGHLLRAETISVTMGDRHGQAMALANLGNLYWRTGDFGRACDSARAAQTLFRAMDAAEQGLVADNLAAMDCPDLPSATTDWATVGWTAYLVTDPSDLRRLAARHAGSEIERRALAAHAYKDARLWAIATRSGERSELRRYRSNFPNTETPAGARHDEALSLLVGEDLADDDMRMALQLDRDLFTDDLALLPGEEWRRRITDFDLQRLVWRHELFVLALYATDELWGYPEDEPITGLFDAAEHDIDLHRLAGDYRCRWTFLGGRTAEVGIHSDLHERDYATRGHTGQWLGCRVAHDGQSWTLDKPAGTYRVSGRLYPSTEKAMIFLGATEFVPGNEEGTRPAYGDHAADNAVGVLERLGPGRYRIGFPDPVLSSGDFEILELRRDGM